MKRNMTTNPSVRKQIGEVGSRYLNSERSAEILFRKKVFMGTPFLISNLVTSGKFNIDTFALGSGLFTTANTLLSACDEIRIHQWGVKIRPIGVNGGHSGFWFDWDDTVTPTTLAMLTGKNAVIVSNDAQSSTGGKDILFGTPPSGPPYNTWYNTGSWAAPYTAALKMYTDGANMGSPIVATNLFMLEPFVVASGRGGLT